MLFRIHSMESKEMREICFANVGSSQWGFFRGMSKTRYTVIVIGLMNNLPQSPH